MDLTRTRLAGILFGGLAWWGLSGELRAQNWQPNWQPVQAEADLADWQQRVLKQTQPQATWQRHANSYQQSRSAHMVAQRPSYDRSSFATVAGPAEPWVTSRQTGARVLGGEEIVEPGAVQFDAVASDGVFAGGGADCGGPGGQCGGCDQSCGLACDDCCDFGWECFDGRCGPWLRGLSIFVGADAFKGPLDRGTNGNFGLNEGISIARPLGDPWGCGYQIGANFVQSDFSSATGEDNLRTLPYRKQYFATAAIFQRAEPCGGFQWGVAYDYLHDIYYQTADLQQIRSETGFVIDDCYEIGYYGAYGVGTNRVVDGKLDPTDMFVLYAKRNFQNGGEGRLWGGTTGNGDGLLGVNLWVPLGSGFALENRVNYLIPNAKITGNRTTLSQERESWGFVIQLVWYPGQNARCQRQNPYRAMFNVADNSLFMVDRLAE